MIRDGNHFIRIDNKWVLIDGPWFETLNNVRQGIREVHVADYHNALTGPARLIDELPTSPPAIRCMIWRPMQWHNYPPHAMYELLIYKPDRFFQAVRAARVRRGWVCEDGIIPATWNQRTVEDRWQINRSR